MTIDGMNINILWKHDCFTCGAGELWCKFPRGHQALEYEHFEFLEVLLEKFWSMIEISYLDALRPSIKRPRVFLIPPKLGSNTFNLLWTNTPVSAQVT